MKVDKMVPKIYYSESRDFSYIGRVLELILNYMKTAADSFASKDYTSGLNGDLITLLATSLGFESKHKYLTNDLVCICSAFNELIKKKGTEDAINEAIRILLTSQKLNVETLTYYTILNTDNLNEFNDQHVFTIFIPVEMKDLVLLKDLFEYILPVGTLVNIIVSVPLTEGGSNLTKTIDNVVIRPESVTDQSNSWINDIQIGRIYGYNDDKNPEIPIDILKESKYIETYKEAEKENQQKALMQTGVVVSKIIKKQGE